MTHHRAHEATAEIGEPIPEMITPVGGKKTSDGTLQPFETDDTGNLKVNVTSGVITATVTNDGTFAKETGGNLDAIEADIDLILANQTNNTQTVNVFSMPANTMATGTITAPAQTVGITVPPGGSAIGIEITGIWTGQIEFEATVDGSNWFSIYVSSTSTSTNATAGNGIFVLPGAGFTAIRTRASALSVGTATVTINASIGTAGTILSAPLPTGTNTIGHVIIDGSTATASAPTSASVGVASAQAVASNTSRRGLVLINTSPNDISFGIGSAAVLNSGITIRRNGGVWEMDNFTFSTAAINAIAAGASSNLSIQEFT